MLAAIIIIALVIGYVSVTNSSKSKTPVKINDLGKELGVEGGKVLEYGTISEDISMDDLIKNFYGNFSKYASEANRKIYFVLGNEEGITVYSTTYVQTGKINIDQSNINIQQEEIQVQDGSQICNPEEDGDLTCTINGNKYTFKLNQGENFYFVISQEIGGEQHVVSG